MNNNFRTPDDVAKHWYTEIDNVDEAQTLINQIDGVIIDKQEEGIIHSINETIDCCVSLEQREKVNDVVQQFSQLLSRTDLHFIIDDLLDGRSDVKHMFAFRQIQRGCLCRRKYTIVYFGQLEQTYNDDASSFTIDAKVYKVELFVR